MKPESNTDASRQQKYTSEDLASARAYLAASPVMLNDANQKMVAIFAYALDVADRATEAQIEIALAKNHSCVRNDCEYSEHCSCRKDARAILHHLHGEE